MPKVKRGGIELHWEAHGDGPPAVIVCHWSGVPSVFAPLVRELVNSHLVVSYDARGTGQSTRSGPHDIATGAADLIAILEEIGDRSVIVTLTDGCNRAVRAAAERPDLVGAVVAQGTVPVPRQQLADTDALVGSDSVLEGFIQMLETDYRSAQRTLMTTANPQMSEEEVRERVDEQIAYCPSETAVARLRGWAADDSLDAGQALGDRLWVLFADGMVGPWFPPFDQLRSVMRRLLPKARLEHVEDGLVSRPDITAAVVGRATDAGSQRRRGFGSPATPTRKPSQG